MKKQYLDELAIKHNGLILRRELLATATPGEIDNHVREHDLISVFRGVYRCAGVVESPQLRAMAAALVTGGALSGRSAARLWHFRALLKEMPEVTLARGRSVRLPGVKVRHSSIANDFLTDVGGCLVTTPERTLLELSTFMGNASLQNALEDALVRKLIEPQQLMFCYEAMRKRGRRRFRAWKELLPLVADTAVRLDSIFEARVFRALTARGLPAPAVQHHVLLQGSSVFLDLAYPELKINIECDGRAAHETVRFADDRRRDRQLRLQGWTVLRFDWHTSDAEIASDVTRALALLAAS